MFDVPGRIRLTFATPLQIAKATAYADVLVGAVLVPGAKAPSLVTREDLAELATDDLLEIAEMDEEVAAALIMKARAHWFEEEQQA